MSVPEQKFVSTLRQGAVYKARAELIEKRKADLEKGIVPPTTITIKVS